MTTHDPRPTSAISPMPPEAETDTGITNCEREAVLSLITLETGQSAVKNSTDGPQAFNHAVTKAIFGMKGNGKWDHEMHFNRAKAVVLAMIASGEIEPIYNDIYAIVGIKLPNPNNDETNGSLGETDPRAMLIAKMVGALAAASQKLGDEQDYHRTADETIGPVLAENERLHGLVDELNATINELRQSPREAKLAEENRSLRQQLAAEQSARELAEGKLGNAKEIARGRSDQINEMRRSTRALEKELRDAKKALGEMPKKERTSYEEGHNNGWTDGLVTMQDILGYAGYDAELTVISALIGDKTNRVFGAYKLLNDIKYAMEQLDKLERSDCKSVDIYNRGKMPTINDRQKTEARGLMEESISHFKARLRSLVEGIVNSATLPSEAE